MNAVVAIGSPVQFLDKTGVVMAALVVGMQPVNETIDLGMAFTLRVFESKGGHYIVTGVLQAIDGQDAGDVWRPLPTSVTFPVTAFVDNLKPLVDAAAQMAVEDQTANVHSLIALEVARQLEAQPS